MERSQEAGSDAMVRVEAALEGALSGIDGPAASPKLKAAMRHAVMPGGARIRPRLCLAVADALGDDAPRLSDAAAAAIELLHCASLVHDDLPSFDNAHMRRGKPSVHSAFGEPVALLAGDALIVLGFETLARSASAAPARLASLVRIVAQSVGMPHGIASGQAWECEETVNLAQYQRMKTGALFAGAAASGAAAAGADPAPWRDFGIKLGEAYQVADDLKDALSEAHQIGKPVGRDAALDRPNAVSAFGVDGAVARVEALVQQAAKAVPDCPGAERIRKLVIAEAKKVMPRQVGRRAA